MMEAWPVNTFRFINAQGESTFVRYVWKPLLGVHSLLLDEANIIGGVDPDYHRRDLHEAIKRGAFPEYELGVQLIPEGDESKYDFDILDDTKLWPEEEIPVEIIGKLTLNRLVENHFAEEEQASFDPATIVPGIDFSNDPVLQGRSFAYRDTDYHRLGTANINEIPVNRPIAATTHNQRDSYSKYRIDVDSVHFHANSQAGNSPTVTAPRDGGYENFPAKVEGHLTRSAPSAGFDDHFSQPRLFWNSLPPVERMHTIETFVYHLGKVQSRAIRQKSVEMFANVDRDMAKAIAEAIGVDPPKGNHVAVTKSSPALDMTNSPRSARTQKVGVIIGNGFDAKEVTKTLSALTSNGVFVEVVSQSLGSLVASDGTALEVDKIFIGTDATLYDALYIVGGSHKEQARFDQNSLTFAGSAYKHYKPIGVATSGQPYLPTSNQSNLEGVIFAANNPKFIDELVAAIAQRRFWNRV